MEKFREIERKFFLVGTNYLEALEEMRNSLLDSGVDFRAQSGEGIDFFWEFDSKTFIRLRKYAEHEENAGVLSVKRVDKGNISDRFETNINLRTEDDMYNALSMNQELYGQSKRQVWKEYCVFWLSDVSNISIYTTNNKNIPLILEVEAGSDQMVTTISRLCHDVFNMVRSDQSLFELVEEADG